MYQISVDREFCAAHALVLRGVREVVHGHNFKVSVTLEGAALDGDGLLLDFHALEKLVDEVLAPMQNADLNQHPAFAGRQNPSAELVAKHIADRVGAGLGAITPPGSPTPRLAGVRVTEAPGCAVTYRPD